MWAINIVIIIAILLSAVSLGADAKKWQYWVIAIGILLLENLSYLAGKMGW